MKKLYKNNSAQKLAAYSAMAGAFVALGTNAEAQVVFTDISPDEEIEIGDLFELDINDDGETDFIFQATSTTGGSWSFARVFGSITTSMYAFGNSSNRFIGYSGPALPYGSALDEGDEISSGGDFLTLNVAFLASVYGGITYGAFADQDDKFLGVKFVVGSDLHFGWILMDATVSPVSVTLKAMGYDSTAETTILAGDDGLGAAINQIPADQLSIYSYGKTVHIAVNNLNAENASVNIYNIAGQVVFSNILNQNGMQFTLANLAEGAYTVKVIADNASMTKQVLLAD
ncbi:MAG: T9SS type A sorting domain-containing protein [Fimbriimonadaceae bacterium]|nr:T9SS type A sorting domain-containing protein [Chitinophagales bacterium]